MISKTRRLTYSNKFLSIHVSLLHWTQPPLCNTSHTQRQNSLVQFAQQKCTFCRRNVTYMSCDFPASLRAPTTSCLCSLICCTLYVTFHFTHKDPDRKWRTVYIFILITVVSCTADYLHVSTDYFNINIHRNKKCI